MFKKILMVLISCALCSGVSPASEADCGAESRSPREELRRPRLRWRLGVHLIVCLLALCTTRITAASDALRDQFITPPPAARPWVFWFTLNGNLTKEGITADLEAMAKDKTTPVVTFKKNVPSPQDWVLVLERADAKEQVKAAINEK